MRFFKPSDIITVRGVVQNLTNFGAAFVGTEDGDSVFVPVRIAQDGAVDVGDSVTCYCIDQTRDEYKPDGNVSARYRAVRLRVEARLSDVAPGSAASAIMAEKPKPVEAKKPEVTVDQANSVIGRLLKLRRAWEPADLIDEVRDAFPGATVPKQMEELIPKWLQKMHDTGVIARCVVSGSASAEGKAYYATSEDVFHNLIGEYELDD
jgi:hypothetical protein